MISLLVQLLFLLNCIFALSLTNKTLQLMSKYPLIDGHNDLPLQLRLRYQNQLSKVNLSELQTQLHTDIPKLRKGRVGAQFWSIYLDCQNDFKVYNRDVVEALEQIDVVKRMVQQYSNDFELVLSTKQLEVAFKKGKIGSMMGMEGGHMIDGSFAALRMFYELGIRYMTLTHVCHSKFADSCAPPEPLYNGLNKEKDLGKKLILEMNRLGMLVDISHVSHQTMRDVLKVTKAPVIFSHSSAFSLCQNPRNVPDDVLRQLKSVDAVVMVNFHSGFVICDSTKKANLENVVQHIEHIARVAGYEYVGLGSDFDGGIQTPVGLEDASKYPNLIERLLERGWNEKQIAGLLGGNLLRVWKIVETVSEQMKHLKPDETFEDVERKCPNVPLLFQL